MPEAPPQSAILVVDLAYGDCGKGTVVDCLARRCGADLVVRFNGGPQAGHNVVTPDGRHHTFSQFGAGTFVPGVRTLLSRFVLVEPYALFNEAAHLRAVGVYDALARLTVDARCPVITPAHQAANRLRELARGDAAHGTCGMGIGETMQDVIDRPAAILRAGELADRMAVLAKLRATRDRKLDELREAARSLRNDPRARLAVDTLLDPSWIDAAADNYAELALQATIASASAVDALLRGPGTTLFEGAQGVLLDEDYGFHPHTTWSTTTFANADALLDAAGYAGERTRLGVLRTYFTRHGAGPLVTEDAALRAHLPEPHNADAGWQGRFRVGCFDAVAARYALDVVGGVDALAVTHLDCLPHLPPRICMRYEEVDPPTQRPDGMDQRAGLCPDPFVREGRQITALRPVDGADFAARSVLTDRLRGCRAVYTAAPTADPDGYLDLLRQELRTPVGLTSAGPTAGEKRVVTELLPAAG